MFAQTQSTVHVKGWIAKRLFSRQETQGGLCISVHFFTIVLKSSSIKPLVNCCDKKSLSKTSEFTVPSERPNAPIESCYVILENISRDFDAEKLKTLEPCLDNIHMTSSGQNNERSHLEEIEVRQPIAGCTMKDERWSQLDNPVYSKLHTENTKTERLHFLEKTIYDEALKLFGHKGKSPVRNLTFQSRRTKHCIELVVQKNTLQAQISATIDPQEQASLQGLLNPIKEKIWSYRRREKHCKKRQLYKESQKSFLKNPYKAGKDLFQPKTSISLSTDKSQLDAYKSEFVKDDKYNIPLSHLQGLPDMPPTTIPFPVKSLDFNDFLLILGTRRNASAPGINAIPYKVYKKCPQLSRFLFNIFKSCLKHCVVPIQWWYAMEH